MKDHVKATIADLRVQVDRLVEVIDALENLPDDEQAQEDGYEPAVEAQEMAQEQCLQELAVQTAASPCRQQIPTNDIGNRFPRVRHGKGVSALALKVARELPEPFSARDLARQAHISRASASQLLTKWHAEGWLSIPAYAKWQRTETFPPPKENENKDTAEEPA